MKQFVFVAVIWSLIAQCAVSQEIAEWRGPGRTGVYQESGLLKVWPENGPSVKWVLEDLPDGYSSVSVLNGMIYFTGVKDSMDVLAAVSLDGELKWEVDYGRYWGDSFSPSRCTPTVIGDKVYVSGGMGDLACIGAMNGEMIWQLKASEKYEGAYGKWGISESLLIHENMVYFTPGGDKTTMVALNKDTGEEIWVSESLNDNPSYTSPLMIEWMDTLTIVTTTENFVVGIDPVNGDIRWTFDYGQFAGGEWRANIQANTPLYDNGKIFVTNGYDHTSVMIELTEEDVDAYFKWADTTLDVHHGGAVKIGKYIYGASWIGNRNGNWVCLEWESGKVMYNSEWENKGSIIAAEGMLYCYDEKKGNIALVKATPEGFAPISTFKVPHGKGPHWSHLVINDKVLYVRHGKALMAYDIDGNQL